MAFNFRRLDQVQLAIDVRMNDFQYFLTTQLGTSGQKKLNRFTVVKFAKLYAFVEMRWTCRLKLASLPSIPASDRFYSRRFALNVSP